MGPREAAQNAEPKGNAKTLRQKDRIRTTLRKVRARPHTKGATDRRCPRRKGISRVRTEAKRRSVFLLLFLCFVKAPPKAFPSRGRWPSEARSDEVSIAFPLRGRWPSEARSDEVSIAFPSRRRWPSEARSDEVSIAFPSRGRWPSEARSDEVYYFHFSVSGST